MSTGPGAKQPLHRLSADDRGPIIIVVAYSWIFVSSLITLIRFGLAWSQRLRFKVDDGTFLLGAAFAVASSVFFHLAANGGLGKHMAVVGEAGLDQYYKMLYVAELMGIVAMASAKTSVILLSDRVAPRDPVPYYLVLGLVTFWTVFSIFATAFQCALPHPWVNPPSECPSHGNLQYPMIILNMITDAILALWILPTLRKLLMDTEKRITVMILFGSRLIVCGFAIVQLASVARSIRNEDVTFNIFWPILWELCVIHLSVLLSTVPRTNKFIAALQSMHTTTLLTEFELTRPNGPQRAFPKHSFSTSGGITSNTTAVPSEPSEAHTRPRSHSHSPSRSARSQEPLVDSPLKLTPTVEQNFSTHISSSMQNQTPEERKQTNAKKYNTNEWRKYMKRSKNDEEMNMGSLFSWSSSTSHGHERIVQTREITQEVEVVPPKESKWVLSRPRRLSRPK